MLQLAQPGRHRTSCSVSLLVSSPFMNLTTSSKLLASLHLASVMNSRVIYSSNLPRPWCTSPLPMSITNIPTSLGSLIRVKASHFKTSNPSCSFMTMRQHLGTSHTMQATNTPLRGRMVVSCPASWVRSEVGQSITTKLRRVEVMNSMLLGELVVWLEVGSRVLKFSTTSLMSSSRVEFSGEDVDLDTVLGSKLGRGGEILVQLHVPKPPCVAPP